MTTTSLILLGNYRTSPIYIYTMNGNNYYSIQDMNRLFFNMKLNAKAVMLKQLFLSNPNNFIKDNHETIYVKNNTLITIARLFNMYHLAELCKLTNEEILGGVADPLLNTIVVDGWKKCVMLVVVERDLVFQSFNGDEWLFIAPPPMEEEQKVEDKNQSTVLAAATAALEPPLSKKQEMLYHWLSSNINTNSHNIIQTLISAAKVKKQQQAIIETRQRQIAFVIPTDNINKSTNKKQKIHSSSSSTSATTSYHQRKKNTAGIIQYNDTTTSLPPSPPTVSHYTTSRKRKSHHTTPTKNKKTKTSSSPPSNTINTTTTPSSSYQQYLIHHGNDNLNLLATQATQMRGLPLSPEVSPSPPPFYHHQHRLPSIQVMLSELNHNHYRGHRHHS